MEDEDEVYRRPAKKPTAISTGTKITISNLDSAVTEEDINDLFSDVGPLKSYKLGDMGAAVVVYKSRNHAVEAISRYNGVPLDGQEMQLTLVGTNVATYAGKSSSKPSSVLDRLTHGDSSTYDSPRQLCGWLRLPASCFRRCYTSVLYVPAEIGLS